MLNRHFFLVYGALCNAAEKIGAIPYHFDKNKCVLTLTSKSGCRRYMVVSFSILVWFIFICLQAFRFKHMDHFNSFNLCYAFVIGTFIIVITHGINVFLWKDILKLVSGLFHYIDYLSTTFLKPGHPKTRAHALFLDIVVTLITFTIPAAGFLLFVSFLLFPHLPVLFGNLISSESYTFPVAIFFASFYGVSMGGMYGNLAFLSIFVAIYVGVILPIFTDEFKVSQRKLLSSYQTKGMMRMNPSNLIKGYREAQVFNCYCMEAVGVLLLPFHGLILLLVSFGIFLAILHRNDLHLTTLVPISIWCVFGFALYTILLLIGGYMHAHGQKTIRSWTIHNWGSKETNKVMKKFAKSCLPLAICYGKTYIITRLGILKFLLTLNKVTFRTIITLRSM